MENREYYKSLIYLVFKDYFAKYSFNEIEDDMGAIVFRNKNCVFKFTFDYSNVDLNIVSLNDETNSYNIKIIHLLFKNKSFDINPPFTIGEEGRLKIQLFAYLEFLESNLKRIADGDFSWSKSYLEYDEKEKKIHEILWSLDIKNPIYLKFKTGDITWKNDILKTINL